MDFFVNSYKSLRGMIPLLRTAEECDEWLISYDECLRLIDAYVKTRRVPETERQRLTLLMSSIEIMRTCVRSKVACILAELDARDALLASSSSDDDTDGGVNHLSTSLQLDDESLTIEWHKIRDALSAPSLSETSWISIFRHGFMQLPREQRQLLRHIARYSTAGKCTLYCIVDDKDVYLQRTKYITAIACTPLTLLHDIENGAVKVREVLSPDTTTITVHRFLCRELIRFLDERTSLPRNSKLILTPLSFRFPDWEHDRITWKSRIMKSGEIKRLWEINYL